MIEFLSGVFVNPLLLLGLAGIALPIIAHLLSRRRFDVVEWGAMQFLNPSRRTRRRLRLEELLLLLVRIMLIALVAFALSRPLIPSGWLTGYSSAGSRDVVLIIDGSATMSRSDGLGTLHSRAARQAVDFLSTLNPGDGVMLIDARDQPIVVLEEPIQDRSVVEDQIGLLPPPSGAGDLRRSCERAIGLLSRSSAASREIIVLTDRQAAGWSPGDDAAWQRFDDVLRFPSVQPRVWVTDVSSGLQPASGNIAIGRIKPSRELTVPDFPIRFQVPVRNTFAESRTVELDVSLDGQRLAGRRLSLTVPGRSQSVAEFEHRFASAGTRLLEVSVADSEDAVTADDRSAAAIHVTEAVPVLIAEGSSDLPAARQSAFFASVALSPGDNRTPWVRARVVPDDEITAGDLKDVRVVILSDATSLSDDFVLGLARFIREGGGALIVAGSEMTTAAFERQFSTSGILPGTMLTRRRTHPVAADHRAALLPYSLKAGWLDRFTARESSSFLKAGFSEWWQVRLDATFVDPEGNNRAGASPAGAATVTDESAVSQDAQRALVDSPVPAVLARLESGDPLLVEARVGEGRTLLMTSTLNTEWNDLPRRPDFVAFLHEAVFQLASGAAGRNTEFGAPLISDAESAVSDANDADVSEASGADDSEWTFSGPGGVAAPAVVRASAGQKRLTLPTTELSGVYRLMHTATGDRPVDTFVVNYDHAEDDLRELSNDDRARLIVRDRMQFVSEAADLPEAMYGSESSGELWMLLLWCFLALLLVELWMTRRLVIRGHADTEQ